MFSITYWFQLKPRCLFTLKPRCPRKRRQPPSPAPVAFSKQSPIRTPAGGSPNPSSYRFNSHADRMPALIGRHLRIDSSLWPSSPASAQHLKVHQPRPTFSNFRACSAAGNCREKERPALGRKHQGVWTGMSEMSRHCSSSSARSGGSAASACPVLSSGHPQPAIDALHDSTISNPIRPHRRAKISPGRMPTRTREEHNPFRSPARTEPADTFLVMVGFGKFAPFRRTRRPAGLPESRLSAAI